VAVAILRAMDDRDALAGLDEVPWGELEHAYGSAEDVPGQLRALRSPASGERGQALNELYGNIFHQGSRYEASAYAVPFLARLACEPGTPQRDEIVLLLCGLAIGYDDTLLPEGLNVAAWRAEVEKACATSPAEALRELDRWVEAAEDRGERGVREFQRSIYDHEQTIRCMRAELAAYDAVRAELPRLRPLLTADDPRLRAATAYLLGWFPEEAAASLAALEEMAASETVPAVLANAFVSAGLLSGTSLIPRLREGLDHPDPLSRWGAAVALARLGQDDPRVVAVLTAALVDLPPNAPKEVHFLDGDTRSHAALTLARLSGRLSPQAVDAVLDSMERSSLPLTNEMIQATCRLVFPDGPLRPLPPFPELTGQQQRLVRFLADRDPESWRWYSFVQILRAWNLPDGRTGCRAYAGLPS